MQPQQNGYWQPDAPSEPVPSPAEPAADTEAATATPDAASTHPTELMNAVTWDASEFVHREKDMMWFVGVGAAGVVLALLAIFLLHSITFAVLIAVMVGAVVFLAVRPPRVLHYQVTSQGVQINDTHYQFHDFRAFGIVQEDALYYITLLPVKRFAPAIDLYFPQEHGEQIVDLIGSRVPMQTVKPDIIDHLTRYLRF